MELPLVSGRKEMSKMRKGVEEEAPGSEAASKDPQQLQRNFSSKVCGVMKMLMGLTRELITGPATTLNDCLEAFFDTNELTGLCDIVPASRCILLFLQVTTSTTANTARGECMCDDSVCFNALFISFQDSTKNTSVTKLPEVNPVL